MDLAARIATGAAVAVVVLSVAGCTVEATTTAPTPPVTATSASPVATPSAAPTTWAYDAEWEAAYQADVAAWPHPVPEGYAWPESRADLPFLGGIGGQQAEYLNAAGIYHCMMIGAAWDAYFTDDDAVASKSHAALADEFAPDLGSAIRVTNDDGTIRDAELASESGICQGFVGDLTP